MIGNFGETESMRRIFLRRSVHLDRIFKSIDRR